MPICSSLQSFGCGVVFRKRNVLLECFAIAERTAATKSKYVDRVLELAGKYKSRVDADIREADINMLKISNEIK
jgi:hypothetical protein